MIHSAAFLRVNGYKEQSQKLFGQAIQWLENRPVQEKEDSYHRAQLASAMYYVGNWDRALDLYSRLSKEEPENIRYVRYLGCLAVRLGNREEALHISKKLEEMKRPYLFGQDIYARACIASLLDEKEAAVRLLREATSQGLLYFEHFYRDIDLEPIRGYPPFQEFIKPKG
jgi:predicted Zn-dependent protease